MIGETAQAKNKNFPLWLKRTWQLIQDFILQGFYSELYWFYSQAMRLEAQLKPQLGQDTDRWEPLPFEMLADELGGERNAEDGTEEQSRLGGLGQVLAFFLQ